MNNMKKMRDEKMKNKTLKNNEANVAIVALILIVAVVVIVSAIFTSSGGKWPTPWDPSDDSEIDGVWTEEIIIEYEDGTNQSLKILQENDDHFFKFAVVTYNDEPISNVYYNIYATATGSGYTDCEIKSFDVSVIHKKNGLPIPGDYSTWTRTIPWGTSGHSDVVTTADGVSIPINAETLILRFGINIDDYLVEHGNGDYTTSFVIEDVTTIGYRGLPGGDWQYTSVPKYRVLNLKVEDGGSGGGGQIVLDFNTEAGGG